MYIRDCDQATLFVTFGSAVTFFSFSLSRHSVHYLSFSCIQPTHLILRLSQVNFVSPGLNSTKACKLLLQIVNYGALYNDVYPYQNSVSLNLKRVSNSRLGITSITFNSGLIKEFILYVTANYRL